MTQALAAIRSRSGSPPIRWWTPGTTECTLSLGSATDTEQLDAGFNMLYLTVSATLATPAAPTLSCQQETTNGAVAETAHETIELVGALN